MRTVKNLALLAAGLLFVTVSCNGGVNPGQIHHPKFPRECQTYRCELRLEKRLHDTAL